MFWTALPLGQAMTSSSFGVQTSFLFWVILFAPLLAALGGALFLGARSAMTELRDLVRELRDLRRSLEAERTKTRRELGARQLAPHLVRAPLPTAAPGRRGRE